MGLMEGFPRCPSSKPSNLRSPVAFDVFRRRAGARRGGQEGGGCRREAARADRPRHGRRRRRGAAAARVRTSICPRGRALVRPRRRTRTCTSSATASTTPTRTLLAALEDFRADRVRRIPAMADRLRESASRSTSASTRRPAARTSPTRCQRRHPDLTRDELFAAYLVPGAPTYVAPLAAHGRSRRSRSSTPPAASRSGRTRTGTSTGRSDAARVRAPGLDGVEAFYATHTEEQTPALHAAARERGLITTGSADFHGPAHDHFNRFLAFEPVRPGTRPRPPRRVAPSPRSRTPPQPVEARVTAHGLRSVARSRGSRGASRRCRRRPAGRRRGSPVARRVAEHDLADELARRGRPRAGSGRRACRARRPRRRPPARPSRRGRCRRPSAWSRPGRAGRPRACRRCRRPAARAIASAGATSPTVSAAVLGALADRPHARDARAQRVVDEHAAVDLQPDPPRERRSPG